jgi:hypothetical protein
MINHCCMLQAKTLTPTSAFLQHMGKWLCTVCNIYIYDEEKGDSLTGISPATPVSNFSDI